MATRKSLEEQIAEQEKRKKQLEERIKMLKAKQSATERKARAHWLIEIGGAIEKGLKTQLRDKEKIQALSAVLEEETKNKNGESFTIGEWLNKQIEKKLQQGKEAIHEPSQESQLKHSQQEFYSNTHRFED